MLKIIFNIVKKLLNPKTSIKTFNNLFFNKRSILNIKAHIQYYERKLYYEQYRRNNKCKTEQLKAE